MMIFSNLQNHFGGYNMGEQLTINLDSINVLLCLLMGIFVLLSAGYGSNATRKYRRPKVSKIIDTNTILVSGDAGSLSHDFNDLTTNATFTHMGAYKWKITMPNLEYADDTMIIANAIDGEENWTWKNAEWVTPQAKHAPQSRIRQLQKLAGEAFAVITKKE